MADDTSKNKDSKAVPDSESPPETPPERAVRDKEIGGRDGPDPTRYGDWELNGRCIDF